MAEALTPAEQETTSSPEPRIASSPKQGTSSLPEQKASSSPENRTSEPEVNENVKDINILLLGCTGVGKSTFINSFVNYLTFTNFENALKRNLIILIPSKIKFTDKYGKSHDIKIGTEDKNEYIKTGEAQTQDVKTYLFRIEDKQVNIRLIDTPGMGDPRGIKQDDINCENILTYIGNLTELHAICFLLKPNESRDTVFFKYCISQIFSRLDKSACNNIIFCFTNTRGTDYNPGETIDILKKNIDEIKSKPPYATIPSDRNIFCFDNECFRYLAAFKNSVDIDDALEERNIDSWDKSVQECWKLFHYVVGDEDHPAIEPHNVRSTKAVNEARRIITRLSKPLADIAQLVQDNIYLLEKHQEKLSVEEQSLEEMKSKLLIPVTSLEVFQLQHPTTVCTTRKCADITQIAGKNNWHYKQRCHEPCGLGGRVAKEIVGDPNLIGCTAIDQSTGCCRVCGCDFKVHMHVYYLTRQVMINEVDPNIERNITTTEQLLQNKLIFMDNLKVRQTELEQEHKIIIESSAKFAHFVQNNAITPFSDVYKQYIEYLIIREKSLGALCNADTVTSLEKLLAEYDQLKNHFDLSLKNARHTGGADVVNPQDITNCLENLYRLKHNGPKIKELYEVQERQIIKQHKNYEYKHRVKSFFSNFLKWNPFSKKNKNREPEPPNYFYNPYYHNGGIPNQGFPLNYPLYPYYLPSLPEQKSGKMTQRYSYGPTEQYGNVQNNKNFSNGKSMEFNKRDNPNSNTYVHSNSYNENNSPNEDCETFNKKGKDFGKKGPEQSGKNQQKYGKNTQSRANYNFGYPYSQPPQPNPYGRNTPLPHQNHPDFYQNYPQFNPQFYFGHPHPPPIGYPCYPPFYQQNNDQTEGAYGPVPYTDSSCSQQQDDLKEHYKDDKDNYNRRQVRGRQRSPSPQRVDENVDGFTTKYTGSWKSEDKNDNDDKFKKKANKKTKRKSENRKKKNN